MVSTLIYRQQDICCRRLRTTRGFRHLFIVSRTLYVVVVIEPLDDVDTYLASIGHLYASMEAGLEAWVSKHDNRNAIFLNRIMNLQVSKCRCRHHRIVVVFVASSSSNRRPRLSLALVNRCPRKSDSRVNCCLSKLELLLNRCPRYTESLVNRCYRKTDALVKRSARQPMSS